MSVKIITDTASDFTLDDAKNYNVKVMPLTIIIGGKEYKDNVTITNEEFYNKLIENAELPKTSQVTPYEYECAYNEAFKDNDEVIVITISKYLSGCYQSAVMAREEHEKKDNIYVVDSLNATVGEKILVKLAAKLAKEGKKASEIAAILEEKVSQIRLVALVDTLEYLKKGGRISSAVAFFGGLLSIKPVIEIDNGQVKMLGKARGSKNANNLLKELVEKKGGIDFDLPFELGYGGFNDVPLKKYIEDNADLYSDYTNDLPITQLGPTIGTHVGPGAAAVAFFSKK